MTQEKESKKRDTTVIIAVIGLIGTVIAALLSSPVLLELIRAQQVTATPTLDSGADAPDNLDQVLVFQEDFDDDKLSGFAFDRGDWRVGKDKSNQVLVGDATSIPTGTAAIAMFGPSDFKDGVIEFRVRVDQFAQDSIFFNFRYSSQSSYSLSFSENYAILGYRDLQNSWQLESLSQESSRSLLFEEGYWYLVRLEASGTEFTVFIDNNRLFRASDSRLQQGSLNFSLNPGYQAMFDDVKVWEFE